MVVEDDVTLLLILDVLESMSSGDLDITSFLVDEVVEGSEVHQFELSWLNGELSGVGSVIELVESTDLHLTSIVGVSECGELSVFMVKDENFTSDGVVHVLEGMCSCN